MSEPVDTCQSCGQTLLTTPDDPMPTIFCDQCLERLTYNPGGCICDAGEPHERTCPHQGSLL